MRGREADDVTGSVDVLDRRAVGLVDGEAAASVDSEADVLEAEVVGIRHPSDRVEQRFAGDALAALERGDDAMAIVDVDAGDLLAESRNVAPFERMWYSSASRISASTNSRMSPRPSISVTSAPSAHIIDAYSMPITPAPTTMSDCAISWS